MSTEPPGKHGPPQATRSDLMMAAIACLLGGALIAVLCAPLFSRYSERGNMTRAISNGRQIVMALKLYAADHDGKYPDAFLNAPQNSNEVFRELFKEETIDSEAIFGCPLSPFYPDGNSGDDENKTQALKPGENHWAITVGVSDAKSGNIPLVYDNPVSATWPPKWDADAAEKPVKGRAWKTGIVAGMNDGGAQILPLASKKGTEVGLKPDSATGKNVFDAAINPKDFPVGKVLDVEVKP